MDDFICLRGTGNAKDFAQKLGISRATVYEYLKFMQLHGAVIKYDRHRRSYYYKEAGSFALNKGDNDEQTTETHD